MWCMAIKNIFFFLRYCYSDHHPRVGKICDCVKLLGCTFFLDSWYEQIASSRDVLGVYKLTHCVRRNYENIARSRASPRWTRTSSFIGEWEGFKLAPRVDFSIIVLEKIRRMTLLVQLKIKCKILLHIPSSQFLLVPLLPTHNLFCAFFLFLYQHFLPDSHILQLKMFHSLFDHNLILLSLTLWLIIGFWNIIPIYMTMFTLLDTFWKLHDNLALRNFFPSYSFDRVWRLMKRRNMSGKCFTSTCLVMM